jgi:hypothetical protein
MTERTYTILSAEGEALHDAISLAGIFPTPEDTVIALVQFDAETQPECRLVAVSRDGDTYMRCVMSESKTVH